jgi:hypothetical protein
MCRLAAERQPAPDIIGSPNRNAPPLVTKNCFATKLDLPLSCAA